METIVTDELLTKAECLCKYAKPIVHGEIRGTLWFCPKNKEFLFDWTKIVEAEENREAIVEQSSEKINDPYEWLETNRIFVDWQDYWPTLNRLDELTKKETAIP